MQKYSFLNRMLGLGLVGLTAAAMFKANQFAVILTTMGRLSI